MSALTICLSGPVMALLVIDKAESATVFKKSRQLIFVAEEQEHISSPEECLPMESDLLCSGRHFLSFLHKKAARIKRAAGR